MDYSGKIGENVGHGLVPETTDCEPDTFDEITNFEDQN